MLTLVLFKFLSDLGAYYAFAGFFAVLAGASAPVLLTAYGLQSLVGLLTYPLREHERLRFLPLALLVAGWLLPGGGIVAWVAITPPALYVVRLVAGRQYVPDWGHQVDIFSSLWKALLLFCAFVLVFGRWALLSAITIPAGLLSLTCCVLLNRSLRHDLSVCCQPRYQVMNLGLAAGVSLLSLGLSSKAFLESCVAVLRWIYTTVLSPILMAIGFLLLAAVQAVMWLFSWVQLSGGEEDELELQLTLDGAESLFSDIDAIENHSDLFGRVCIALALILAAVIVVLVFRWLAPRARKAAAQPSSRTVRTAASRAAANPLPFWAGSPVQQVRVQYQKFLRLYRSRGLELRKDTTSQDVARNSRYTFDPAAVRELRQLYIAARYNDQATKADAARAKELYQALKRSEPQ